MVCAESTSGIDQELAYSHNQKICIQGPEISKHMYSFLVIRGFF